MNNISNIINKSVGELSSDELKAPIDELGIDSIDLVTLRVELDRFYKKGISDETWFSVKSISELIQSYEDDDFNNHIKRNKSNNESNSANREYLINMPQLALGGLSESWLLKEVGDSHWGMLCEGLGQKSFDLKDELGNRLYATFVRIRITSQKSLNFYQENERLYLQGNMHRFGESVYFSKCKLKDLNSEMKVEMMTTFSSRGENNNQLRKGKPGGVRLNKIEEISKFPLFGEEYRSMRKGELSTLVLFNHNLAISDNSIFTKEYKLNPYTDLNGVNLLYFAAYPIISDYCELDYFSSLENRELNWALSAYTLARDIFYFSNCNIDDSVIYTLNEVNYITPELVSIQSTLSRKSDGEKMAKILTIKKIL